MNERIDEALDAAMHWGGIDGADHKMYVIDQMVRALTGGGAGYEGWVKDYEGPDSDGEEYEWDCGVAP